MSLEAMLWALKNAPVINAEERLILIALADHSWDDGRAAWPSQATLAERSLVATRTVRRRLEQLEARGLISRGDQLLVQHLRSDHRPVVWDLMIPLAWFRDLEQLGRYWQDNKLTPLTAKDRPDLPAAPALRSRVDKGTTRPHGGTCSPPGLVVPPDSESTTGGLVVHDGGTCSPTTLSLTLPLEPQQLASQVVVSAQARTGRATGVPESFPILEHMIAWARDKAPGVDPHTETEQWQDWHRAKGDTARDWNASWRTWMRRAQEHVNRGQGPGRPGAPKPSTTDQRVAAGMALMERLRSEGR